jgi:hypothetical protein
MRGKLRDVFTVATEVTPDKALRSIPVVEASASKLPAGHALVILFDRDASGRPMTAPAVLVPQAFVESWNADFELEQAHPNEQCTCASTPCVSTCPAQQRSPPTCAWAVHAAESAASAASTTASRSLEALVAGMLAAVHPDYGGQWVSPTSIADALAQFHSPIEAVQYLSEQIGQEAKRADVEEAGRKRKHEPAPQPPPKKPVRDASLPLSAFLTEVNIFDEQVLMATVRREAANVLDAIRRGDVQAWGKFGGDSETNHLELTGSGEKDRKRLGPWPALLAACFALSQILQHFVPVAAATSSPAAKGSGGTGKSPTSRSTTAPASPAPAARPRNREELQAIIDTLNTNTGFFTLDGRSIGVLPHTTVDWAACSLGKVPIAPNFNTVLTAIGQTAAAGGVRPTPAQEASAVALKNDLIGTATCVRIAIHLVARGYGTEELVVGGKPIGAIANVLTETRATHMRKHNVPKPPAMLFLSRMVTRLNGAKGSITPPFWKWVKAHMMAVFDYLCLPHQLRRLELPAMYPTPAHPPCAGQVYHPRPPAPPRAPTPNRDHGRTGPGAKGYARRAGTRRD